MTEPLTDVGNAALISREGLRTKAYKDSVGVWTIGVGHTSAAGPPVVTPGLTLTVQECHDLFAKDVLKYAKTVDDFIVPKMLEHERDAFASICYNIGQGGFKSSTFAKRYNNGDKAGCAEAILWWNQPSEIIPRRKAEQSQFLTPYDVALPKARSTDAKPVTVPDWPDKPDKPVDPDLPDVEAPPDEIQPLPFPGAALQRWEIGAIQARLAYLGYTMVGPADGVWGPKTTEAIAALQKQAGIVADYGRLSAAALADDANRITPPKHTP